MATTTGENNLHQIVVVVVSGEGNITVTIGDVIVDTGFNITELQKLKVGGKVTSAKGFNARRLVFFKPDHVEIYYGVGEMCIVSMKNLVDAAKREGAL